VADRSSQITVEESRAFVETFSIEPTGSGILDGLTFAVKDLIDVAGRVTGCGNPTWRSSHPPATNHAVSVEQLLSAGARCTGKTLTDELAFSLLGENFFYGTPLNPRARERVPGGSSCGSASAVACGLADFALGTDTGGSVRIPASNCGIFGFRPTHGRVSVAGVNPLAPTFDTVGILASELTVLTRTASALLGLDVAGKQEPETIHLIPEAFQLCDPEVKTALEAPLEKLRSRFGKRICSTSLRLIDEEKGAPELELWREIYRMLQGAEAQSCLGAWVATADAEFGPLIRQAFEMSRSLDRTAVAKMIRRRETYFRRMNSFLSNRDLLCIPTSPCPAPIKGSIKSREQAGHSYSYYPRTLSLTSLSGVARLPQVTLPVAEVSGAPVGLSFLARTGEDAFLLGCVQSFADRF
jgi:amidase